MNGKQLAKVEQEKDLGVVISSDLKQVNNALKL